MSTSREPELVVRHFRQILMWPLQLIPLRGGSATHEHCEALLHCAGEQLWHEVEDEFTGDAREFQERHYREFVTFLPYVQRFLYGQARSRTGAHTRGYGESPIRVLRRTDICRARLTFMDGLSHVFEIKHVDLYFYYDVDVAMLAFEFYTDDLPLSRAQELLFRFGRCYPAQWDEQGVPDQCMRNVEWLSADGSVLSSSDFGDREVFLRHVCEHRVPRVGAHWQFLLGPMVEHHSESAAPVRYRQLEYHRLPKMTYLSFDDPFALAREDFVRLGLATAPDDGEGLGFSDRSLEQFEQDHCYDRFWVPERALLSGSTRVLCTARSLVMIGSAKHNFFADPENGLLGQFRHQYFLLGMIGQFHRAALLMLSDRMVLAVSRLDIRDPESVARFRRHMRHTTEIFLRFNHRYWFHEVSKQSLAKDLFQLWGDHLGNDKLFDEVRAEVLDMGQYLDSDAARRTNETVLRLTVVTIFSLVGTIATGFLGMNLIDESSQPFYVKVLYFLGVTIPAVVLTLFTVQKSGPLSEFIDAMSNDRLSPSQKLASLRRVFRSEREPGPFEHAEPERMSLTSMPPRPAARSIEARGSAREPDKARGSAREPDKARGSAGLQRLP
jgi:hypothetical protein